MERPVKSGVPSRLLRPVLALALALAAASQAVATTKKTDKVNLTDVQAEKRVKQPKEKIQTRFTRNEAFLVATETRLLGEINKAIAYLSKQSARMPKKSPSRLAMLDQLVNLRLESAVYYANNEMRQYDRAYDQWQAGGGKGPEPKLDESKSRNQWSMLAKESEELLAEYPRSKNADTTLFNMGLAFNFLKREKDAARVFSQLIAKYPNSQKAGDAYFALGDFYFDRTDFRNAMNNYQNALKFKQSRAYPWSLFKLGWCNYNLGQYERGLGYWKQTVAESARAGRKGLALKDEALRDMVYAFAELRQVEPAIQYYRRNGGERFIGRFLILLSTTFSDQGQYGEAIKVLKRYQQVEPYSEEVPDTQKEIISLNFELGRVPVVWAELARYPKLYGPGSAWGSRIQNSNKKRYLEVQQLIKDQILYYSKLTHKNAQKDENKALYGEAIKGYNLYLTNYPKSREVAEVKFNMADIYYFSKQYREAGKFYLDIAMLGKDKAVIYDPKTGKGANVHKDSTKFMLDAYYQDYLPDLKVLLKAKPDFTKPARPLPETAKNFIRACGIYTKFYPDNKEDVKTCDVMITETFYRSADKKMSMKYLWMLAKKYSSAKEGEEAVLNLIPLYGTNKKALVEVLKALSEIKDYQKGKIAAKLEELRIGVKEDLLAAEKEPCKRAKAAMDLYKEYAAKKTALNYINEAAINFIKCGKVEDGIGAYMVVIKKYENSPAHKDALLEVAKLQENRLELAAASQFFLEFARKYPKENTALGSLAKACELQAALGAAGAVNTCLAFAQSDMAGGKLVFNRMMRTAFSARDTGRLQELVKIYDGRFKLSAEERIVAYAMIYNATNGEGATASQAAQTILNTAGKGGGNITGEALRAVGGLTFRQVNGEIGRFAAIKLKGGTVDALAASIQAKVQALGKVQAAYDRVIKTGDAFWGVAALYQLGYARELVAKDLENPPEIFDPATKKAVPREAVAEQLAGDAKAARQEAAKFYQLALQSVEKYLVYNVWAARAHSGLARISGKNINFDDLIIEPDFLGAEVPENIAEGLR